MNEAMKVKNIEEAMEFLDIPLTKKFVYGYTEPGLLSSFTHGVFSSLVDMHHSTIQRYFVYRIDQQIV